MNKKELREHRDNISLELETYEREYEKNKTNHILHLAGAFITMLLWTPVWIVIAIKNSKNRKIYETKIDESKKTLMEIDREIAAKPEKKKTIECPWCAEDVMKKAKVCKHCGREIAVAETSDV